MSQKASLIMKTLVFGAGVFAVLPLQAHEPRENVSGVFTLVVGQRVEPAYAGEPNAFDLFVRNPDGSDTDVQEIELEVRALYLQEDQFDAPILASARLEGDLRRDRSTPNRFNINYLPSRTGAYGFHISGTINGVAVEERFVCRGGSQNPNGSSFGCVDALQRFPGKYRPRAYNAWHR